MDSRQTQKMIFQIDMISSTLYSSKNEVWETPQYFFDQLDSEFHFDLDPCALPENAKCKRFFTPEDDGLQQDWGGQKYSVIRHMVRTSLNGARNAMKKVESQRRLWCCSFIHAQIRGGSMIGYMERLSYDLSKVG